MKNTKHNSRRFLAVLVALAVGVPAAEASILSGNVSFNQNTGLYTYSYTLDNAAGPAPIKELSVLVDSSQNTTTESPTSSTNPAGWSFLEAVSGSSANAPLNEYGIFWEWYGTQAVSVGGSLSGFSFTTPFAPVAGTANNYFLWSNTYTGGPASIGNGGVVEWGHVVAPDLSAALAAPVPVPAAAWLFGSGLLGLVGVARRHRKEAA